MSETDGLTADEGESRIAPAYGSYPSLIKIVDKMKEHGIPPVLDRSFFGNQSGSLTAQQRGSLRFLGLIDADYRPTDEMTLLVEADEAGRKEILRELAMKAYAEQVKLAQVNGTQGQLADSFRKLGITGSTVERAISFYLTLAEDLGLPTSSHFKKIATPAANGTRPRRRKPATKAAAPAAPPPSAPAAAPALSPDVQKASYVQMLMELAKANDGEGQKDLLDRIERALGLAAQGGDQGSG